jgi:hypothetical protein
MDEIPQDTIDRMMVKCGRRCCICRRFRPTLLQVHHIVLKSEGGTNEDDNLIVICLSCHTDIHTQVPFARRFSPEELKSHRDAMVRMVAEGVFPADVTEHVDQLVLKVVSEMAAGQRTADDARLSQEAVELLLAAAHATGNHQGVIALIDTNVGLRIYPGNHECPYDVTDRRAVARYRAALKELEGGNLIESTSEVMLEVTHLGYLAADDIASAHSQNDGL